MLKQEATCKSGLNGAMGIKLIGLVTGSKAGTSQGGVISPLLANIYLHEVLDVWFEIIVKPRLKGKAFLRRYADDAVLVFEQEEDANKVMEVLPLPAQRIVHSYA